MPPPALPAVLPLIGRVGDGQGPVVEDTAAGAAGSVAADGRVGDGQGPVVGDATARATGRTIGHRQPRQSDRDRPDVEYLEGAAPVDRDRSSSQDREVARDGWERRPHGDRAGDAERDDIGARAGNALTRSCPGRGIGVGRGDRLAQSAEPIVARCRVGRRVHGERRGGNRSRGEAHQQAKDDQDRGDSGAHWRFLKGELADGASGQGRGSVRRAASARKARLGTERLLPAAHDSQVSHGYRPEGPDQEESEADRRERAAGGRRRGCCVRQARGSRSRRVG